MKFVDQAKVRVQGGDGGNGVVRWRREIYVPRGGPDGGDGGNGGAVIFVAEPGLNTLIDFSFQPLLRGKNGEDGSNARCTGRNGEDLLCNVPLGTQVFYNSECVADLSVPHSRWIAARGGLGGKGNAFFKSSTRPAPDFAQKGQTGESFEFLLVLKSVADVGLVGLPNVGKSTLISRISRAHPLVADYPFTTLVPHLGVVEIEEQKSSGAPPRFVVADIPGLIPGAHEGKGLGIDFLKHIERTSVLAQLIDINTAISESDPAPNDSADDSEVHRAALKQFEAIETELSLFSEELATRPRIVLFSKGESDLSRRAFELLSPELKKRGLSSLLISSHTGLGISELKQELFQLVKAKA